MGTFEGEIKDGGKVRHPSSPLEKPHTPQKKTLHYRMFHPYGKNFFTILSY